MRDRVLLRRGRSQSAHGSRCTCSGAAAMKPEGAVRVRLASVLKSSPYRAPVACRVSAQQKEPSRCDGLDTLGMGGLVDPCRGVEQPVKGFASCQRVLWIDLFLDLGEGVEQGPGCSGLEFGVPRMAPFVEDRTDLGGGDGAAVDGADDEVVGRPIGHRFVPVRSDAAVEVVEPVAQLPHSASRELLDVARSVSRVLAAQLDLSGKREVVADEDPGAGHETGGVGLVVRVSQPDDPRIVGGLPGRQTDLKDSEIAGSFVAQRVDGGFDGEAGADEQTLDLVNEFFVGEREPGLGSSGCSDASELFTGHDFRSTM